jgi:hypothetical protein
MAADVRHRGNFPVVPEHGYSFTARAYDLRSILGKGVDSAHIHITVRSRHRHFVIGSRLASRSQNVQCQNRAQAHGEKRGQHRVAFRLQRAERDMRH